MAFDTSVEDDSINEPAETVEVETVEVTEDADDEEAQADTEEATDDDAESEDGDSDEEETETEPEPKKKGRASERIQQLLAEKKAMEAEVAKMRAESQGSRTHKLPSNDGAPVKPNIEDYDLDSEGGLDSYFAAQAEYDEKHQDWKLDQRLQQREQAKQQEQRNAEITQTFNARFKANPEFKENFQQLATLMQDKPIQADPSELYQGDDLMDLLEHVAADHDLYYELAEMPPSKQYAEFGRIHATIQAKKGVSKAARQSKAPKPPNHTKANAPIKRDQYSQSDDDFMRSRGL